MGMIQTQEACKVSEIKTRSFDNDGLLFGDMNGDGVKTNKFQTHEPFDNVPPRVLTSSIRRSKTLVTYLCMCTS